MDEDKILEPEDAAEGEDLPAALPQPDAHENPPEEPESPPPAGPEAPAAQKPGAAPPGGPGGQPPKGAAPVRPIARQPAGFLEKVCSLGVILWGLAGIAALGGLVFFVVTFISKHKII